jgi:hypothetical protein
MGVTRAVRRDHPPGVSRSLAGLPSRPAQNGPQRIHRPPQRTSPFAARLVGRPRSPTSREAVACRRSGTNPVAPARQARRIRSRVPTRGVGCSDGFLGTYRMFGSQRWEHDSGTPLLARPNTSRPISVSFIQRDTPARRILRSGGRWLVVARADVYGCSGIPARWRAANRQSGTVAMPGSTRRSPPWCRKDLSPWTRDSPEPKNCFKNNACSHCPRRRPGHGLTPSANRSSPSPLWSRDWRI